MRKKIKRIVPFILVGVLVSSFVMTNYNKAREVKAVVGVDDLAIAGLVTTLLLAYGYATTQYYNNTDGANALADEWEEEYNQARLTVINGGGGSDNGDDDDDKNKFEDTDGDGKITEKDIPPFSNFLTKNAVTLSANASLLLTPIVTKFITDKFCNGDTSKVECLADASKEMNKYLSSENIDLSSYKYFMKKYNIQSDYYELHFMQLIVVMFVIMIMVLIFLLMIIQFIYLSVALLIVLIQRDMTFLKITDWEALLLLRKVKNILHLIIVGMDRYLIIRLILNLI